MTLMRSVLMIFLVLVVVMLGCSSDNGGEPKEMIGRPQAEGVAFNDSKIIDKRLIVLLDNSGSITDQSGTRILNPLKFINMYIRQTIVKTVAVI